MKDEKRKGRSSKEKRPFVQGKKKTKVPPLKGGGHTWGKKNQPMKMKGPILKRGETKGAASQEEKWERKNQKATQERTL